MSGMLGSLVWLSLSFAPCEKDILVWTKNYKMHIMLYNFRSYSHRVCLGVLRLILITGFLSIQHQSQVQTCINYPLVWEKGFLFRA